MKRSELRKLIKEELSKDIKEYGRAVGRFRRHGKNFDAEEDKSEFPWQDQYDPERWNDDFFDRAGLKDVTYDLMKIWENIRKGLIDDGENISDIIGALKTVSQDLNNVIRNLEDQ
jgi:Ser/Thr protein kinase RdoA (MazF antagonist)